MSETDAVFTVKVGPIICPSEASVMLFDSDKPYWLALATVSPFTSESLVKELSTTVLFNAWLNVAVWPVRPMLKVGTVE